MAMRMRLCILLLLVADCFASFTQSDIPQPVWVSGIEPDGSQDNDCEKTSLLQVQSATQARSSTCSSGRAPLEQEEVIREVLSTVDMVQAGVYSNTTKERWSAYQADLLQSLSKRPQPQQRKLRILIASPVTMGMLENVAFNLQRLNESASHDEFHLALFYYQMIPANAPKLEGRIGNILTPHLVLQKAGPGCKVHLWRNLVLSLVRQYDYIWLMDGDLRMDYFSWDLYRHFLLEMEPLVSQPSVIAWSPGGRSTDHAWLRMRSRIGPANHLKQAKIPLAWEVDAVELQATVISTKMWPAIFERMNTIEGYSAWSVENFWNVMTLLSKAAGCAMTRPLVVNVAPLRHENCHDMQKTHQCLRAWVRQDCFNVSRAEATLLAESMQGRSCNAGLDALSDRCVCNCTAIHSKSVPGLRRQWFAPTAHKQEMHMEEHSMH